MHIEANDSTIRCRGASNNKHLANVFETGEQMGDAIISNLEIVQQEGVHNPIMA